MQPFIHPATQKTLEGIGHAKPHAVLITGPIGLGLQTLARYTSDAMEAVFLPVVPQDGALNVETVRSLYDVTKVRSRQLRCIVLDGADTMSHQAQNALLKLLEEPTDNTCFILLAHEPDVLLPTIRSRVQRIDALPITTDQTESLLDALQCTDATKRTQVRFIAEGLPALMTRLVTDEAQFDARAAIVKDARTYLQGTPYERLVIAHRYAAKREDALTLVLDAMKLLERSIGSSNQTSVITSLQQLQTIHERLTQNGSVKLQLTAGVVY